jgi:hypothetical protein
MSEQDGSPKSTIWLRASICTFIGYFLLLVAVSLFPPPPYTFAGKLIRDFQGNLLAGFIANICFLFVALHLDALTGHKLNRVEQLSAASEKTLRRREYLLEIKEKIQRFEQFMKTESYHNVRFPDLKFGENAVGPEYTIRPIREGEAPKRKITEMNAYFLVEVLRPSAKSFLKPYQLEELEKSPIKERAYAYCRFVNSSWELSHDGSHWYEFYLSSKVGPVERGMTANTFMGLKEDPKDMEKVLRIPLTDDGLEYSDGTRGVSFFSVFLKDGLLYLKIDDSNLKSLYLVNSKKDHETYNLLIESMGGYATGEVLKNIKAVIQEHLAKLGINIPKVPYYNFPDPDFEAF